jgi:hypothetical protein
LRNAFGVIKLTAALLRNAFGVTRLTGGLGGKCSPVFSATGNQVIATPVS